MKRIPTPFLWLAVALIGLALVAGSFIMVAWLKLQPCPLCIAQRTLFMLMGGVALVAFFMHRNLAGRIAGGLTVLTALSGAAEANRRGRVLPFVTNVNNKNYRTSSDTIASGNSVEMLYTYIQISTPEK